MSENDEQKSVSGEPPAAPKVEPTPIKHRYSGVQQLGTAALAIVLYLLLVDTAVETFLSGAPVRWFVTGAVAGYVALSVLLWQRLPWATKAAVSLLVLLGLLAWAAWQAEGLGQGVNLLRQSTPTVLAAVTALAVLFSGAILLRAKSLPIPARATIALLMVYAVAALIMGILSGTPYSDLFHGRSVWGRLPFWLQGPFIGGAVLVIAGVLYLVFAGIVQFRRKELPRLAVQVLALTLSLAIAASGVTAPAGPVPSEPGGTNDQGGKPDIAVLEHLYDTLESRAKALPRDGFDPQAVVDQVGRDPVKLYQWVRDNTYWVEYQGSLRGPTGVLMDRLGNSMDRALLLAELLRLAGHEVALARGRLDEAKGLRLLTAIRQQDHPAPRSVVSAVSPQAIADLRDLLKTRTTLSQRQIDAMLREWEQSVKRTQDAIDARVAMLAGLAPDPKQEDPTRQSEELAAIEDHWWVQVQKDGNRFELDPLDLTGSSGEAAATATETVPVDGVDAKLFHEVAIRVVVEQWRAGKLSEQLAMEHVIRPAQLIGQRIALTFIPLKWPEGGEEQTGRASIEQLKARVLAVKEWRPVLQVGDSLVAQASFSDSGGVKRGSGPDQSGGTGQAVGDLLGALSGGEPGEQQGLQQPGGKEAGQLSAVWLEFELRSPGKAPQKIRREVMDVLTPSARASATPRMLELSKSLRLERGLALLGEVEILPLVSDLSPEFITYLYAQAILARRAEFLHIASLGRSVPKEDVSAAVEGLLSMPGALHALALGRQASSPVRAERFLNRPNILCFITRPKVEWDRLLQQSIVDIVNNDVAIRPGVNTSPYRVRLVQGVVDTVVEGAILPAGERAENAADVFAEVAMQRKRVVLIRRQSDPGWQALDARPDARARVEQDLDAGYVIIAPAQRVEINGRREFAWWRLHPVLGEALGVMETGFHGDLTETVISNTKIADTLIRASPTAVGTQSGILGVYGSLLRFLIKILVPIQEYLWLGLGLSNRNAILHQLTLFILAIRQAMYFPGGLPPLP